MGKLEQRPRLRWDMIGVDLRTITGKIPRPSQYSDLASIPRESPNIGLQKYRTSLEKNSVFDMRCTVRPPMRYMTSFTTVQV